MVLDLVSDAEALVENCRPGQLAEVGLGEDIPRPTRPDHVIARTSSYGGNGSDGDETAFGAKGEAISGLRHLSNPGPDTGDLRPVRVGISTASSIPGRAQLVDGDEEPGAAQASGS